MREKALYNSVQELRVSEGSPALGLDPCYICHGNNWTVVREGKDLCRPHYEKVFRLMRCSVCGHVMQNPIPSTAELQLAYAVNAGYDCYRSAWKQRGWPVWKILRLWTTIRRISQVERCGRGRDLLEIGVGGGDFLVAASRRGWKVSGVEYSREMVQAVRDQFGLDVRCGELNDHQFWFGKKFDVIAFWNVLEHLRDPLAELKMATGYLAPGGRIVANIPTRYAAERGLSFGQSWALLDTPRHINFFDAHSLRALCDRAGLQLKAYTTPPVQSLWCYYMSCWKWASARRGSRILTFCRTLVRAAVVTLGVPYIVFQALRGTGTEALVVAVKR